jgi:hypothetical protein
VAGLPEKVYLALDGGTLGMRSREYPTLRSALDAAALAYHTTGCFVAGLA